jgi:hypothetical protein
MPHPDPDRRRDRSIVIVDTGPIWELILFRAVNELGFASLRNNLQPFYTPQAYENCGDFLSSFGKKITSSSVVAELYRKIRDTDPNGHRRLWQQVYEEFTNMEMDEDIVKLLDMDLELVSNRGPIDVSLIEIARRNSNQDPVILTLDTKLHAECRKAQIGSALLIEVCNPR